jgi:hypothetical protein
LSLGGLLLFNTALVAYRQHNPAGLPAAVLLLQLLLLVSGTESISISLKPYLTVTMLKP